MDSTQHPRHRTSAQHWLQDACAALAYAAAGPRTWKTLPKKVANTSLPTRGDPKVYTRTCNHTRHIRQVNTLGMCSEPDRRFKCTLRQAGKHGNNCTHIRHGLQPEAQVQRAQRRHGSAHGVADDVPRLAWVLQRHMTVQIAQSGAE